MEFFWRTKRVKCSKMLFCRVPSLHRRIERAAINLSKVPVGVKNALTRAKGQFCFSLPSGSNNPQLSNIVWTNSQSYIWKYAGSSRCLSLMFLSCLLRDQTLELVGKRNWKEVDCITSPRSNSRLRLRFLDPYMHMGTCWHTCVHLYWRICMRACWFLSYFLPLLRWQTEKD